MRLSSFAGMCRMFIVCALLLVANGNAFAQADPVGMADKVLAVIGRNKIILQSELEGQFAVARQQDPTIDDTAKCNLLQQMVVNKLLVEQAERDSLLVSEEEVESNLDNKLRYFIRQ